MARNERDRTSNQTLSDKTEENTFYPNGISAVTGLPLPALPATLLERARQESPYSREATLARAKAQDSHLVFGTMGDVDSSKLEEAGWGVIFHAKAADQIKKALKPLLEHRNRQAGALFRVFENRDGYQPDETCAEWLARHKVSHNPVDPVLGVPFYLMIVGSPGEIPFEFQYQLDIYWAVGRLHFDDADDYGRYAESVVAYETATRVTNRRSAAVFSTAHDFDKATQMFSSLVATPLAKGDGVNGPLGQKLKYNIESFIGDRATKETIVKVLSGKSEHGSPALLLTGTHGMAFSMNDVRQVAAQGALVCQDWSGYGNITESDYFTANDVPGDAKVSGLIHFLFACYGAGCPKFDDFPEQAEAKPKQIAWNPLMSRLPQKLLAHPNGGALAVFGHVGRAWSLSFYTPRAGAQLQGFRDVMSRILRGNPVGLATDQFDVRRAALSAELADTLRDISFGKVISDNDLVRMWIARNDARDYILLGDPGVRLRVEDLGI